MQTINQFKTYFYSIIAAVLREIPCPAHAFTGMAPQATAAPDLLWANIGGPRSREISTPLVSRLLTHGSVTLGLHPVGTFAIQPKPKPNSFRELAHKLLKHAGFLSPEHAWQALARELPNHPHIAIDLPQAATPSHPIHPDHQNLIAALVLGRTSGSLFSPHRPIIWSERRLAREVALVHCNPLTFNASDHD